jgi:hypothetical protein
VLCSCDGLGFDGTVMSSINSMSQYQQYFNLKGKAASTGIIFVSRSSALDEGASHHIDTV